MYAIVGANGNMGRRYSAILKTINVEFLELDVEDKLSYKNKEKLDGVIICTPTDKHLFNITEYNMVPKILCEKPLCSDEDDYEHFKSLVKNFGLKDKIFIVNQYGFMPDCGTSINIGTIYNFYNTGKDGLLWDCFNIIGLDKTGFIDLKNDSPLWKCSINGLKKDVKDVNESYLFMINDWLQHGN